MALRRWVANDPALSTSSMGIFHKPWGQDRKQGRHYANFIERQSLSLSNIQVKQYGKTFCVTSIGDCDLD